MRHKYKNALLLLLLFTSIIVNAQNQSKTLVSKEINKGTKTLSLDNVFGNITVSTWNKSNVFVEVIVESDDYSDKEFNKLLNKINIQEGISNSVISFKTEHKGNDNKIDGNNSFEINYTIKVPLNANLEINNSFGNITIPDHHGNVQIDLEYGNLKAGSLKSAKVKLAFGNGQIQKIEQGELEAKYADKLSIAYLGSVSLINGFSNISIDKADQIDIESKYGKVSFGTLDQMKGDLGFSGLIIQKLVSSVDLEVKYMSGDLEINEVSKDFQKIYIDSKFSQIKLKLSEASSFKFNSEHKFGSLKYDKKIQFIEKVTDDMSSSYKGYYKDENAKSSISVSTNYGNLNISIN